MNTVRTVLILTFAATVCLLFGLMLFAVWRERGALPAERVEYSKLYLDAFKVIAISFFVALIGILIPAQLREARYRFQRMKESRAAYSKAKTGVAYLPLQLCSRGLTDAVDLIQQVHFEKHQAELYRDDLQKYVKHLGVDAEQWGATHYDRLLAYRTVLEGHIADWDSMTHRERAELLLESRTRDRKEHPKGDIIG